MGVSTKDFWRLFADSRLRTAAESYQLCNRFAEDKRRDAAGKWSHALGAAKWLIAEGALTRFQAKVLLDGRAGPFVYGPYQLVDRIGRGRLAGCFRAVHAATGHPVLLWFLSGHCLSEPEAYAAASAQLAAASEVVHPCLSQTYQLVDLGDYKFVAIEDLRGATAEKTLAAEGRLQPSEACRVMRQVALAAAALHAGGLVHGDIRPENVWIDGHGNGRLLQIPLSRDPHLPPSSPLDQALSDELRAVVAEYAAPELGFAGQTPDALCDIYAIGCATYQLLAGGAPFRGGSKDAGIADKMTRHATEAIQPLEPFGVPPELAKLVAFAMAKDRKLRYSSAAQLAESLGYFVPADELSIMPQPAPTYAAYEAWRTTSDGALPVSQAQPAGYVAKAGPIVPEVDLPDESIPAVPTDETPAIPSTADVEVDGASDLGEFTFAALPQATSPGALLRARRIRARNRMAYALALLVALCIGGSIGFVVSNREAEVSQPVESDRAAPENDAHGPAAIDLENVTLADNGGVVTVPDDGQTLWASPAAAEPIAWDYLPVRAEMVLALRPAELLRHAEGTKLLSALGPVGASAWAAAEADIKMPLAEVDQLTVAWTNDGGGWSATYVVRLAQGATGEQLTAKWQSFEPKTHGAQAYFVDGARAYAAPAAEQGRRFVISSAALMPDLLDAGPGAAPLRRDVFKLLQTSDSQRLVTLLFTTSAVLVDSKQQFAAAGMARFHDAASWMLHEEIQAAAISVHLDENCYLEMRLLGGAQVSTPEKLAAGFRERLKRLARDVEDYLSRVGLHPHGSKVLIRLGSMARFVERQLRIGAEDDQVVINCYLPAVAAHNLVLAAELAISQPAGSELAPAAAEAPAATAPPIAGTESLADKLGRTVSLSFERDTLERSIQILSAETGVPMEILGADLQTEGITKNQSFKLDEIDQPAAEILRKIMLLANPDGKLVYVIKPRTPGGEAALFITTRLAAQRRGDQIPPEVAAASKNSPSSKQK